MSGTRIYKRWLDMKHRCYGKNRSDYKDYGGRGITVCDEWLHDFTAFYRWSMENGYSDNLTLDRIDVDGNYEPDNCRWTTIIVQANNKRTNRRFQYGGKSYTIAELDRLLSGGTGSLSRRLYNGWTLEEALSIPKGGTRI